MNVETVLQSVLASENPILVFLLIALIAAIAGFSLVAWQSVKIFASGISIINRQSATIDSQQEALAQIVSRLENLEENTKARTHAAETSVAERIDTRTAMLRKDLATIRGEIEGVRIELGHIVTALSMKPRKISNEKDKET